MGPAWAHPGPHRRAAPSTPRDQRHRQTMSRCAMPSARGAVAAIAVSSRPASAYIFLWLIVVQKAAGRRVAADLGAVVEQTRSRQLMQHERAEAADRTLLHRDQNLVLAAEPGDERGIQRLGEARAGDRRRKP